MNLTFKYGASLIAVFSLLAIAALTIDSVRSAGPSHILYSSNSCPPCRGIYNKLGIAGPDGGFSETLKMQRFGDALKVTPNTPDGISSYPTLQKLDAAGKVIGTVTDPAQIASELAKLGEQAAGSGDQCIPVAPGQFEDGNVISGNAQFKPSTPTGYEQLADQVARKMLGGAIQDNLPTGPLSILPPNKESDINFALRKANMPMLQEVVNKALEVPPQAAPGKPAPKVTVILPSAAQAREFIASGGKSYTINGVKVTAGGKYTVGKAGTDGVTFDENCEPKQGPVPSPENPLGEFGEGDDVSFDGGGGGGGGGGDQGGGGGGGLASILPALMQMLGQLGQQKQQAQQQQAQNPLYNAQGQCSEQGVSPVCGVDGKTYTNECYLQQMGITLAKKGVCDAPAASPTPVVTPDAAAITNQLSQSGIPASLLATIQASIVSALTAAFGGNVGETVIR